MHWERFGDRLGTRPEPSGQGARQLRRSVLASGHAARGDAPLSCGAAFEAAYFALSFWFLDMCRRTIGKCRVHKPEAVEQPLVRRLIVNLLPLGFVYFQAPSTWRGHRQCKVFEKPDSGFSGTFLNTCWSRWVLRSQHIFSPGQKRGYRNGVVDDSL